MTIQLFDLEPELARKIIAIALSQYGEIIGEMESPNYRLYTFDRGAQTHPRYMVAKAPKYLLAKDPSQHLTRTQKFLYEINQAFQFSNHYFAHPFTRIELVLGVPIILAQKRDCTLRDVIAVGPCDELVALTILYQMLHVLSFFRELGLEAHQDIKPENIFLNSVAKHFVSGDTAASPYMAYLADFGLANAFRNLGKPYGSRPYMAPEMYERAPPGVSYEKVDVFGLGVVLFELLTGGIHPIGKETALIWPTAKPGESKNWEREDRWKKWARSSRSEGNLEPISNPELRNFIRRCIDPDKDTRLSIMAAELECLEMIRRHSSQAATELQIRSREGDEYSRSVRENGWPWYEDQLKKLNEYYG